MLAGQEDVLEVVVDLTVPHFFRHFDRTARRRAADIVVQNVDAAEAVEAGGDRGGYRLGIGDIGPMRGADARSEEHTSELQSLMRSSYAVFCLKKKKKHR